jgi:hypothetical protein
VNNISQNDCLGRAVRVGAGAGLDSSPTPSNPKLVVDIVSNDSAIRSYIIIYRK